ncbi:MAG: hypothetical protein BroJett011_12840 [Chloroflexota bacterium]|nr:MAG: hypothetical protein BroJett011_12840 [Chloroflexota bacterium]
MTHQVAAPAKANMTTNDWVKLGLITTAASIIAVLVVQALALAIWPEIALFAPLDSYVRSAIFTLVPVVGATALLAWLVDRRARPIQTFITISVVVLIVSIIPDYLLPVPHKTLLASSVAAFLHVVAAVVTVWLLVTGFQRRAGQGQ